MGETDDHLAAEGAADRICGRWSTDATASGAARIRNALTHWLSSNFAFDRQHVNDMALAANEALANVVEHAYSSGDHSRTAELDIVYSRPHDRIIMTITDRGHWRLPAADPLHLRGRGLPLMEALASEVSFDKADTGTQVRLVWDLAR